MERDATTDVLVTELRQVIADLRRGQEDLRQERNKWQAAHEREQAAHAATLSPPPQCQTAFVEKHSPLIHIEPCEACPDYWREAVAHH